MTALEQYERLESTGLWKETADDQRREVIVSFGDASLVLSDHNENPLTHWSLAAVRKTGKNGSAVVFAPDGDTEEELEISDETMLRAIETIRARLRRGQPKPGRVRWIIGGGFAAIITALILFWFPAAIARYAASIVPDAVASQIGQRALTHVEAFSGSACSSPLGDEALRLLENRLIGTPSNRIFVTDMGARLSSHLPGGIILINRKLVETYSEPEVAAGYILMERAIEDEHPPMLDLFSSIGTRNVVRFLTAGTISDKALHSYAEARVTGGSVAPTQENLLALFEISALGTAAFARTLDDNTQAEALIAGAVPANDQRPLMRDREWLALQAICE
jgi:hypothetical protein